MDLKYERTVILRCTLPGGDQRDEQYNADQLLDPSTMYSRRSKEYMAAEDDQAAEAWGRALLDAFNKGTSGPSKHRQFVSARIALRD